MILKQEIAVVGENPAVVPPTQYHSHIDLVFHSRMAATNRPRHKDIPVIT
jgi:hypothetical protein